MTSRLKLLNHPAESPQPRGRHHKNVRPADKYTMSITRYKRLTIALSVVCIGMIALYSCLFWNYARLKIQVASASDQTKIFEQMRVKGIQSDPAGAAGCLEYVVSYYPSGTKQETGSRLDVIVERERVSAQQAIVAYLRTKTDKDLGERPEAWIQKYAKQ